MTSSGDLFAQKSAGTLPSLQPSRTLLALLVVGSAACTTFNDATVTDPGNTAGVSGQGGAAGAAGQGAGGTTGPGGGSGSSGAAGAAGTTGGAAGSGGEGGASGAAGTAGADAVGGAAGTDAAGGAAGTAGAASTGGVAGAAGTAGTAGTGGAPPSPLRSLVTGGEHACVLWQDGVIKCWGQNEYGQLGLGDIKDRGDQPGEMGDDLPAVDLGTNSNTVIQLSLSLLHSCALRLSGKIQCWGNNKYGQLGLGDTNNRGDGANEMGNNLLSVDLGTGSPPTQIVTGLAHTCVLRQSGAVQCWGDNEYGQLGLGDTNNRGDGANEMGEALGVVNLGKGAVAVELVAGDDFTCARLKGGATKCWGRNEYGQLGLGDTNSRGDQPGEMGDDLPAVDLGAGSPVAQIGRGGTHNCVRRESGEIKCWGDNKYGQLGLGDSIPRGGKPGEMGDNLMAAKFASGSPPAQLIGGFKHACLRRQDGTVQCWGANEYGQLGLGDLINRGNKPDQMELNLPAVPLPAGAAVVQLAAGDRFTCARRQDDTVQCWGQNEYGQLGLGDKTQRGDNPGEVATLPFLDLGR